MKTKSKIITFLFTVTLFFCTASLNAQPYSNRPLTWPEYFGIHNATSVTHTNVFLTQSKGFAKAGDSLLISSKLGSTNNASLRVYTHNIKVATFDSLGSLGIKDGRPDTTAARLSIIGADHGSTKFLLRTYDDNGKRIFWVRDDGHILVTLPTDSSTVGKNELFNLRGVLHVKF